jgi:hypothetical protein
MAKEIEVFNTKQICTLVIKPRKAKVLRGKWVYALKSDAEGFIIEFKARWVACGSFQQKKDDKDDFYAPVVSEALIKIVFSLIAVYDLLWRQVDFKAAYFNADREGKEVVYLQQPTGFEYYDDKGNKKDWVCSVDQAPYGLRDSALLWNK